MLADLPPNSSDTRYRLAAAAAMMRRPVAVEPVNEITSTRGSSTSCAPSAALPEPVITFSTPGGRSVAAAASPINAADHGVSGAALRMTVQPAPRAATHFARVIGIGAVEGGNAPPKRAASL